MDRVPFLRPTLSPHMHTDSDHCFFLLLMTVCYRISSDPEIEKRKRNNSRGTIEVIAQDEQLNRNPRITLPRSLSSNANAKWFFVYFTYREVKWIYSSTLKYSRLLDYISYERVISHIKMFFICVFSAEYASVSFLAYDRPGLGIHVF